MTIGRSADLVATRQLGKLASGNDARPPGVRHHERAFDLAHRREIRSHRVRSYFDSNGFTPIDLTEIALVVSDNASPAARKVADLIADFCGNLMPKAA